MEFIKPVGIFITAFMCESLDSTIGMGFGTIMTPLMMMAFGFSPLEIVPVVLLSELMTGVSSGIYHDKVGNVDLKPKTFEVRQIIKSLKSLGYVESYKRGIPRDLKVAIALISCSVFGAISAVYTSKIITTKALKLYIGGVVVIMGLTILMCLKKQFRFSWIKVTLLGLVASFNKGLTGGGYGPIIVSGQLLSGVAVKSAVGITSFAEGLTCFIGLVLYTFASGITIKAHLAVPLLFGALLAVPFSAKNVKKIRADRLKLAVAVLSIMIGAYTVISNLSK